MTDSDRIQGHFNILAKAARGHRHRRRRVPLPRSCRTGSIGFTSWSQFQEVLILLHSRCFDVGNLQPVLVPQEFENLLRRSAAELVE